jgi:hypothetical protein
MSPIVLFEGNCHATEKSEAIAMCKEMPVIPFNLMVDLKIITRKRRAKEEERHKGSLTPPPKKNESMSF